MPFSFQPDMSGNKVLLDTNMLIAWGGVYKQFQKGDIIFHEDSLAIFYHQVEEGTVKMTNCNEAGKEFIQGIFHPGDSFGEPPLFYNGTYPASAIAETNCVVLRLRKEQLLEILKEHPEIHLKLTACLAQRLQRKSIISRELACYDPQHRIVTLLKMVIEDNESKNNHETNKIPYTRQQIADMCGLRVETVIRTIKQMEEKGIVEIQSGKVFWKEHF